MTKDFETLLTEYLDDLQSVRNRGASEATIRDRFLTFLRKAFPRLSLADPIWLEEAVPGVRVRGGFADALFGDLVFEFKRRLDEAAVNEGRAQLRRYLLNQQHPERYFGILTDGQTLQSYAVRGEELVKTDELRLDPANPTFCALWLDSYLSHHKHLVPSAEDVALRFGERSPTFWRSMELLRSVWEKARADSSLYTRFAEWKTLLSYVYGEEVGDEDLFLRHSYLALIARVLAYLAICQHTPGDAELGPLVTGTTFSRMGLDNFVTDDFFAWVLCDMEGVRQLIGALATRFATSYDLKAVNEDLLKELYQELVDPSTRHDLGEFYTPDWLAEFTLKEAGFPPANVDLGHKDEALLLDPACGSGTFLFIAAHRLRASGLEGERLVDVCQRHLAGLDVHPLAVAIARTNLVLALGEDFGRSGGRLHVPVYMANAFAVPESSRLQAAITIPVDVDRLAQMTGKPIPQCLPREFQLPESLAAAPQKLGEAIDQVIAFANPTEEESRAREGLKSRLQKLGLPQKEMHYWFSNFRLMRWLLSPPATDTVWQFILRNACAPAILARRRFRFVVGNPPWLSYRYIRRRDYQEEFRRLVIDRFGLLKKEDAHLFTQMEMATLFFAFCAEHYVAKEGSLAFVMPRSILTGAKQHERFRERYLASARRILDCQRVTSLFNVPSCVVVWDKKPRPGVSRSVPVLELSGKLPGRNLSGQEAAHHLQVTERSLTIPRGLGESPYLKQITNGATIVPRGLWFVRSYPKALLVHQPEPYVETDPEVLKNAKEPWKNVTMSGEVEAEFLFATLLSDNMMPFGWRKLSVVVLPITVTKSGDCRVIGPEEALVTGNIKLCRWLRQAEQKWRELGKSKFDVLRRLDWQKTLSSQHPTKFYKVLYNTSGTHLCSCVVDPKVIRRWEIIRLKVAGFVADTKTYWLESPDADEVHYLCAVLNAACVDEFIKPFQSKGAFGATRGGGERDIHRRPFEVLPIPKFDPSKPTHQRLAELSKICHQRVADLLAEMDDKERSRPIGQLRQQIRRELAAELDEINTLVAKLLRIK